MALSGSVSTGSWKSSAGKTRYYTLSWTATQSIAGNYSTISWTLSAAGTYVYDVAERTLNVTIDGETVYTKTDRVMRENGTVATGTKTIYHNTDGSRSFSVSLNAAVYYSTVNCTGSNTFTLNTIARASSVSATSAYIGNNSTITISRASSSFTHTLTYNFGGLTGTIATKTTSTSVAFTLPTSFYAKIPNATSGTGTITCTTYNGSTAIGTSTCNFTANTSSSACAPTLNPSVYDSNSTTTALTGDSSKFVKYYSNATYNIGAAARNSATMVNQRITCGSLTSTNMTGTLNNVESASFVFRAFDSRGYLTEKTVNKTLINYVKITCALTASITVDGVASFRANGNYFNGSFGAVSNTLTVQYRYKVKDGTYSDWSTITASLSGNTYTADATIEGLNYRNTYVFQVRATDKLATATSDERSVKAMPVFDWGDTDLNINVPVFIAGNPLADFVLETGTDGMWYYEKWASGKAVCYGKKNYGSLATKAWGYLYASSELSVTFPSGLFIENPQYISIETMYGGGYGGFVEKGYIVPTKDGISGFSIVRSTQATFSNATLGFHIIGRWY